MCGIAGILRFDGAPADDRRVGRVLQFLRHRGPDGEGVSRHGRCTLIHTRLAIVDLPGGAQPMEAPACGSRGSLHVVFNGEIYNHRELRRELESYGHHFRSDHSDTEVLLLGYRQWGTDLPRRLNGMFAFAIWDDAEQRLFLARDRVGKKPLFVRQTPGELVFGSLVSTLVAADDAAPEVDHDALLTYLQLGYTFERSLIRGVREVSPATWELVRRDGAVRSERYWSPAAPHRSASSPDELRATLAEAVALRLEADVPVACFLSGGIDSSVMAALAQAELRRQGRPPLRTFSVRMPDPAFDESADAAAIAAHLGCEHTTLEVCTDNVMDDLRRLMAVTGEPTADSSLLPTHWLCKTTREHVKVALSGDGGDELFMGYDRYRAISMLRRYGSLLRAVPLSTLRGGGPRSRRTRLRRLIEAARAGGGAARQYEQMIGLFPRERLGTLVEGEDDVVRFDASDPLVAAPRWDLTHYLPFDVLRKVDRASMAVALEVRCPLLDVHVVDYACGLPMRVLMPRGRPKALLRDLAAQLLPPHIATRPKRGFGVPLGAWFRTTLRDVLHDHLLQDSLEDLDIYGARHLLDAHVNGRADHTHRLFALLQLVLWRQWLNDPQPARTGID